MPGLEWVYRGLEEHTADGRFILRRIREPPRFNWWSITDTLTGKVYVYRTKVRAKAGVLGLTRTT